MTDKVYHIPVTQYLRPNGRKRDTRLKTMDRTLHAKATAIMASGFVFEAELLDGDIVSGTITDREHGDFASMLARNGKDVVPAMEKMIRDFNLDRAKKQRKDMEDDDAEE